MPRRYDESCLAVYIYKPKRQQKALDLTESGIRETLKLNTVTKVTTDSEIIYDEGDTRPIRKDIILTIEAIITQGSDTQFSDSWEYGNERPTETDRIQPSLGNAQLPSNGIRGGNPINNKFVDTAAMITFFEEFLSTPGLVVDLAHFPAAITSVVPSVSNKEVDSAFSNQVSQGFLVDSFNGPKPINIAFTPLAGGNDFQLTWKVKYSVSLQSRFNYASGGDDQLFDFSSELRLDIDKDGDLEIIVAGTVYAPNPRALYAARNKLHIITAPKSTRFSVRQLQENAPQIPTPPLQEGDDPDSVYVDLFAQLNGFYKKTTFNVEKSGRSAKFSVTYTQVKSNSAMPLGVRDIEFSHEISSSLFGEDVFQGAGFTSWKSTFNGKIKIPHRFHAAYAWHVIFFILAEKTRKLKKFNYAGNVKTTAERLQSEFGYHQDPSGNGMFSKIKGIPTFIRLKHNVFKREVDFTIDYLVVCPLQFVMSATCLFERTNNDYYQRFLLPRNQDGSLANVYSPNRLSQQWLDWVNSTDPGAAFDPTSQGGANPLTTNREFHDNAGTQIVDGGHEINPFVPKGGTGDQINHPQIHSFVTTVIDPNELDPDYELNYPDQIRGMNFIPNPVHTQSLAAVDIFRPIASEQISPSPVEQTPSATNSAVNGLVSLEETVDPRFSWVKYEESYTVSVTHPTIPVEGLSEVDADWHSEPKLYKQYINNDGSGPLLPPEIPDPSAQTRHSFASNMKGLSSEGNPNHPEEEKPITRKTYALKGSRYYVTVRGYAIRVKYPIPIPTVISIAGHKAIKVGEGRSQITPSGLGGNSPLYTAAWEQTYTVDASLEDVDILKSIESTGASIFYS